MAVRKIQSLVKGRGRAKRLGHVIALFTVSLAFLTGILSTAMYRNREQALLKVIADDHFKLVGSVWASRLLGPVQTMDEDKLIKEISRMQLENPLIKDIRIISFPGREVIYALKSKENKLQEAGQEGPVLYYLEVPISLNMDFGLEAGAGQKRIATLFLGYPTYFGISEIQEEVQLGFVWSLSNEVRRALNRGDLVALKDNLQTMVDGPGQMVYAQLIKPNGQVIFLAKRQNIPDGFLALEGHQEDSKQGIRTLGYGWRTASYQIKYFEVEGQPVSETALPVEENGEMMAILRVGHSLQPLRQAKQAAFIISVLTVFMLVSLIALAAWLLSQRLTAPLRVMAAAVQEIGKGNWAQIPVKSSGIQEISSFSLGLDEMVKSLRELDQAAHLQQALFPPATAHHGPFVVATRFLSNRMLTGDLAVVTSLPDGRLGVALGEVHARGAQAGMCMVLLSSFIETELQSNRSSAEICQNISHKFWEKVNGLHLDASLILGRFDPTGRLSYACCGLPAMVQFQKGVGRWLSHGQSSPRLGQMEKLTLDEGVLDLGMGDCLLMVSDGLLGTPGVDGGILLMEGLQNWLKTFEPGNPDELLNYLEEKIHSFTGEQPSYDGVLMVAVQRVR